MPLFGIARQLFAPFQLKSIRADILTFLDLDKLPVYHPSDEEKSVLTLACSNVERFLFS